MKLVQKHWLKGTQEFEIVDDAVNVKVKSRLGEEAYTVVLTILNPEPVETKAAVEFHSRVRCSALLSFFKDKPSANELNAFVSYLSQRATQEYNAFAGMKSTAENPNLPGNVYDEPPEFDDIEPAPVSSRSKNVDVNKIADAITLLKTNLDTDSLQTLLTALESVQKDPANEAMFTELVTAFNALGPEQGAVLTYAPYIGFLLSDDPYY